MIHDKKAESKRGWTDPALIVLVRNKPEEAVLDGCKTNENNIGIYPSSTEYACDVICEAICLTLAAS